MVIVVLTEVLVQCYIEETKNGASLRLCTHCKFSFSCATLQFASKSAPLELVCISTLLKFQKDLYALCFEFCYCEDKVLDRNDEVSSTSQDSQCQVLFE